MDNMMDIYFSNFYVQRLLFDNLAVLQSSQLLSICMYVIEIPSIHAQLPCVLLKGFIMHSAAL